MTRGNLHFEDDQKMTSFLIFSPQRSTMKNSAHLTIKGKFHILHPKSLIQKLKSELFHNRYSKLTILYKDHL